MCVSVSLLLFSRLSVWLPANQPALGRVARSTTDSDSVLTNSVSKRENGRRLPKRCWRCLRRHVDLAQTCVESRASGDESQKAFLASSAPPRAKPPTLLDNAGGHLRGSFCRTALSSMKAKTRRRKQKKKKRGESQKTE